MSGAITYIAVHTQEARAALTEMEKAGSIRLPKVLEAIGVLLLNHHRLSSVSGLDPETGAPFTKPSHRATLDGGPTMRTNGRTLGDHYYIRVGANYSFLGNDSRAAIAHQTGMTIRPKAYKFLAIPILENLRISERAMRPREFENTRVVFGRGWSGGVILQRTGKGPKKGYTERAIFSLRRFVTIPQRNVVGVTTAVLDEIGKLALTVYDAFKGDR